MASCKIFGLILFNFVFYLSSCELYSASFLNEFTVFDLQKNILAANENPVCVLYRNSGSRSILEKKYNKFTVSENTTISSQSWRHGSFSPHKYNFLKNEFIPVGGIPGEIPVIRCYIGYHIYDKHNITSKKSFKKWLQNLEAEKDKLILEASEQMILNRSLSSNLLAVGFANLKYHHEVETILHGLKQDWEFQNIDVLMVHQMSEHDASLSKAYGVTKKPAIIFIENNARTKHKPAVVKVFSPPYSASKVDVDMFMYLRYMNAVQVNKHNYNAVCAVKSKFYVPMVMLFYLPSALVSYQYVEAFYHTVEYFKSTSLKMRFGTMEVDSASVPVVTEHIRHLGINESLPMLVLLRNTWKKNTVVAIDYDIFHSRPTLTNIYEELQNHNALLNDLKENIAPALPWGEANPTQLSYLQEGPNGTMCYMSSHNETISEPFVHELKTFNGSFVNSSKKSFHRKKQVANVWHNRFDMEEIDKKLERIEDLHLVTTSMWHEVIHKSHVPKHPFYFGEKWQGEIIKTSLVAFIIEECGNCKRKMPLFKELAKTVRFLDGGAFYLANCTADPQLCQHHKVTGFPTLIAYRGTGWLENVESCTSKKIKDLSKPVETEYFGVLLLENVMEWFVTVSKQAMQYVKNSTLPSFLQNDENSARLVANLVPRNSSYLLQVTQRNVKKIYPFECLRLACELLYGQIDCYLRHHPKLPHKEFQEKEKDLIITEIELERVDNFNATIMTLGKPLIDKMEAEAKSSKHSFHKPHKYKFPQGRVKCEDDPAFCTDLIVDFSRDHFRIPVTKMDMKLFHTRHNMLFQDELPVLVTLSHQENITSNSSFYQLVNSVAEELYEEIVVVTVDVSKFSTWAHSFVPKGYIGFNKDYPDDIPPLYLFPRFCIIYWHNHHRAAFFPHVNESITPLKPFKFEKSDIILFIREFLKDPRKLLMETEHF